MDDINRKISAVETERRLGENRMKTFLEKIENEVGRIKHIEDLADKKFESLETRFNNLEGEMGKLEQ
jgi:hypothetical protein